MKEPGPFVGLEGQAGGNLNGAGIAAVDLVELAEYGVAGSQVVGDPGAIDEADGIDFAGRVLRVIKPVEQVGAQLELHAFVKGEALGDAQVPVVDAAGGEDITAGVGK